MFCKVSFLDHVSGDALISWFTSCVSISLYSRVSVLLQPRFVLCCLFSIIFIRFTCTKHSVSSFHLVLAPHTHLLCSFLTETFWTTLLSFHVLSFALAKPILPACPCLFLPSPSEVSFVH
ncbi:hypothetical protein ILYODFUR_031452 [Ilyodon furcidens]|uniref:Uncharacterized protein n=1 Tax=Ilyodon furcidens TaxID=33524 RepID=A0ABV0V7R8_9TELE